MKNFNGTSWAPAKSWNGVWWDNLAITEAHVASFTGANGRVASIPAGRSFTLIVKHVTGTGTYGRVGPALGGRTRLRFYGDAGSIRLQFIRAQNGVDFGSPIEFLWTKSAGETWSSAVYDGHTLKGTYNGDTRTTSAPIDGFDDFAPSGTVPLLCETAGAIAILVPGKLTQTQIDEVISAFETSRTTKVPPALLSPVAPVANLGPSNGPSLDLPETSPRTMFFTTSTNGSGCTIRNANGSILDNRLGLVNYDNYSRCVYIDRTGTQAYLDNPGRSWAMCAWWDGQNAGLLSQRDSLTKQAEASLTPMPWTVVNGATGTRLLAYDSVLPFWQQASITNWLAWVER